MENAGPCCFDNRERGREPPSWWGNCSSRRWHRSPGLYCQTSGAEPPSYSHLAEASVARGQVASLQAEVTSRLQLSPHPGLAAQTATPLLALLQVLAGDLPQPLPPLDWSFLEPLQEEAVLRGEVVSLLARHASVSRTAMATVERHLGQELPRDTALAYMEALPLLARSLAAPTLGLFSLNSLKGALEQKVVCGREEGLASMLTSMGETLGDRLEVLGPGAGAARGRRSQAANLDNLERRWGLEERAADLARRQG